MEPKEKSRKLTFELPPGWHAAMQRISETTGVSLKYLYTLAVDRLLSDTDTKGVEEAAWEIERRMRQNPRGVSGKHRADEIGKRYSTGSSHESKDRKSRGKKSQ